MNISIQPILALLFVSIFTATSLTAQFSFIAPEVTAKTGDTITTDIKVSGFEDVIAMQLTVQWDTTIIDLLELNDFAIDENFTPEREAFGIDRLGQGLLPIAWIDETLQGISIEDNATIFTMKFVVVSNEDNTLSDIAFTDSIAVVEVGRADGMVYEVERQDGMVIVDNMEVSSSTLNIFNSGTVRLYQNYPNPFRQRTTVQFDLTQADLATINVTNADGKLVFNKQQYFAAGSHQLTFGRTEFPYAGIYTCTLQTKQGKGVLQFIVLD